MTIQPKLRDWSVFLSAVLFGVVTACRIGQAAPPATQSDPQQKPAGFMAESNIRGTAITLDFSKPPEFALTMKRLKDDGKEEQTVIATTAPEKLKPVLYKFVKSEIVDAGWDKCIRYCYSKRDKEVYVGDDVSIWTDIKSVSPQNLEYMKIDRVPFCIVQFANAAGIFPVPLNRKGASPQEVFQANGPVPFKKDGKWGYRDPSDTRVVIEPRFDEADWFSNERAIVHVGGKVGYIDLQGRYIVEPSLGFSQPFGKIGAPELAAVSRDRKHGVINKDGKFVVDLKYDWMDIAFYDGVLKVTLNGKSGYVRKDGRIIFEPQFAEGGSFCEGLAAVQTDAGWGYVDKDGAFAIEAKYERAYGFSEGLGGVELKSGKWGFIDKAGKLVIDARFDAVGGFSDGLSAVGVGVKWSGGGMSGGKWGYIDRSGKIVIDLKFSRAGSFWRGRAEAELDGESGFVHRDGRFSKD